MITRLKIHLRTYYGGKAQNAETGEIFYNVRFLGNINDDDGKPLYPVFADYWNSMPKFAQNQYP